MRLLAAVALVIIGIVVVARLWSGTGYRRYLDASVLAAGFLALLRSGRSNVLVFLSAVVLVAAVVGFLGWLRRIGGLERFFWAAALSYFLYGDKSARQAAVLACRLIPIRALRNKILAGLDAICVLPDTSAVWLMLVLADKTQTAEARTRPIDSTGRLIQARAMDILVPIRDPYGDNRQHRVELARLSLAYERALFAVVLPRADVFFDRLNPEAVKRVDEFFTS